MCVSLWVLLFLVLACCCPVVLLPYEWMREVETNCSDGLTGCVCNKEVVLPYAVL